MNGSQPVGLAFAVAMLAVALSPRPASAQELSSSVDRTSIGIDEVVGLNVTLLGASGRVGTPEGQDFTVQSTSTSMQMEYVNGRQSNRTTFAMTLRPMRVGELTIGRVPVRTNSGMIYTEPITITVTEARPAPELGRGDEPVRPTRRGGDAAGGWEGPASRRPPPEALSDGLFLGPVPRVPSGEPFIIASVTEANPVVGQQLVVDYLLFTPASAFGVDGIELTEPAFSGAWFRDVTDVRNGGFNGRLGTRRVNGELYEAQVLRSYVVFPLDDGEMLVPTIELTMAFRGFARQGGRRIVSSAPLILDVVAAPEGDQPPTYRPGNVGVFEISMQIDNARVRVGDTVNLTLSAHGSGLLSRLALPAPEIDGARVYPGDQSHTQDVGSDLWMRGVARSRMAIVPEREGSLRIPAVTLHYYDPWKRQYVEATTQELVVSVVGVNPSAVQAASDAATGAWTDDLPALRPVSSSAGVLSTVHLSPAYAVALSLPAALYFLVVLVGGVRSKRRESAGDRQRDRAAKVAISALRSASAKDVVTAMRAYLADISGQPAGGLTTQQVRDRCVTLSNSEAAEAFADALSRAEAGRYGGEESAETLIQAATASIELVEAAR